MQQRLEMGDAEIKELRETVEETTLCRNNESLELGDAEAALAAEQAKARSFEVSGGGVSEWGPVNGGQ